MTFLWALPRYGTLHQTSVAPRPCCWKLVRTRQHISHEFPIVIPRAAETWRLHQLTRKETAKPYHMYNDCRDDSEFWRFYEPYIFSFLCRNFTYVVCQYLIDNIWQPWTVESLPILSSRNTFEIFLLHIRKYLHANTYTIEWLKKNSSIAEKGVSISM